MFMRVQLVVPIKLAGEVNSLASLGTQGDYHDPKYSGKVLEIGGAMTFTKAACIGYYCGDIGLCSVEHL